MMPKLEHQQTKNSASRSIYHWADFIHEITQKGHHNLSLPFSLFHLTAKGTLQSYTITAMTEIQSTVRNNTMVPQP